MLRNPAPGTPDSRVLAGADPLLKPVVAAVVAGAPLLPVVDRIVRALGFEGFACGTIADPRPGRRYLAMVWTTRPQQWLDDYDRHGYIEVDPRITHTWYRTTPLVWDAAAIDAGPKARAFLDAAARWGIRSGVAVAFNDPTHARFVATFDSPISPVDAVRRRHIADRMGSLMVLSAALHDLLLAEPLPGDPSPSRPAGPLSGRERECLQMAARGMTSADIGFKLGIKERTANYHFQNCYGKLGVLNRKEAIAAALTRGLIRVDPL